MSDLYRNRLDLLKRRARFLRDRIAATPDRNLSHDAAEAIALEWAVGQLTPAINRLNWRPSREELLAALRDLVDWVDTPGSTYGQGPENLIAVAIDLLGREAACNVTEETDVHARRGPGRGAPGTTGPAGGARRS